MKRELYTQMRTVYETTVLNPHTFRVTVKTKDMVDGPVLEEAVAKAEKEFDSPYGAKTEYKNSGPAVTSLPCLCYELFASNEKEIYSCHFRSR